MKPGIYIAQVLCPQRHCTMALVGPCEDQDQVDALSLLLKLEFAARAKRPAVCPVCFATELHVETARTLLTMEDGEEVAANVRKAGKAKWN